MTSGVIPMTLPLKVTSAPAGSEEITAAAVAGRSSTLTFSFLPGVMTISRNWSRQPGAEKRNMYLPAGSPSLRFCPLNSCPAVSEHIPGGPEISSKAVFGRGFPQEQMPTTRKRSGKKRVKSFFICACSFLMPD